MIFYFLIVATSKRSICKGLDKIQLLTRKVKRAFAAKQIYEEFSGRRLDSFRGYQNTLSSFINTLSLRKRAAILLIATV